MNEIVTILNTAAAFFIIHWLALVLFNRYMLIWTRYFLAYVITYFIFYSVVSDTHPLFYMLYKVSPVIVLIVEGIRAFLYSRKKNKV